ncbi:MAG: PadR family transcriptional regulator [Acidimicrobiia bacterium]|nr:PadR family transcriptional regulator [Acidimicrobiia bacterium]
MTRVFRNGELQRAVLEVLAEDGPQHGYAILRSLSERLDGRWRASPGAVYPALLGLQDAGLIEAEMVDGTRTYSLSGAGRRAAGAAVGVVEQVRARAARALPVEPSAGVRGPTAAPRTLPGPHQDE